MATPAFKTLSATNPWQNLNTPQTLWASLYLIWALDVLLLIAAITGARVHRGAMQTVGKDSAPSIIHAQHIRTALADMDANAANELLGEPGTMPEVVKAYEKRRVEAASALIAAARNITYPGEQAPIEAIQVGMGTYERLVQRARDLHEVGDAAFVNAYGAAAQVMDSELLPKADELDGVNHDQLRNAYAQQSTYSITTIVLILLMGAALVGALIAIQKFLNKKTRRILNPMLILATLVTLGFVLYTFSVLGAEREDLRVAKDDAFESIHALWRARAVAYAANADESRYLLDDAAHANIHEQHFNRKALALATLPSGSTYLSVLGEVREGKKVQGFTGYLADELNNITFDREQEAASDTLARFIVYLRIDGEIRSLQKSGKHAEAVKLCIGTAEGQSNWAFDKLDQALGDTLDINQKAFDAAVNRGFSAVSYFEVKAGIIAVIIAGLAFLGLIKRIQEYR